MHNLEELDLADNQLTSLQALPLPRYDDDADDEDDDDHDDHDDHDDEEDADDTGKPGINITGNQLNSRQPLPLLQALMNKMDMSPRS